MSTVLHLRHASINDISSAVIGAAIEVHRILGPGLLESAYEQSLAHEFSLRQIPFERQKPLALNYKGMRLDCGFRLDFLVADSVVVEVKALEPCSPSTKLNYSATSNSADGSWACS